METSSLLASSRASALVASGRTPVARARRLALLAAGAIAAFVLVVHHYHRVIPHGAQTTAQLPGGAIGDEESDSTHIVLVVIDDAGHNDLGFTSVDFGDFVTPRMDALAADGVVLSRYYSAPFCSPARASLLTGQHFATQLGMVPNDVGIYYPIGMPLEHATLATLLRDRLGFATHLVGKWNLGHFALEYYPTRRGFDTFYGLLGAGYDNYSSYVEYAGTPYTDLVENEGAVQPPFGVYSTTLFGERAIGVVEEHAAAYGRTGAASTSRGLFLMLAFNAVHGTVSIPDAFGAGDEYAVLGAKLDLLSYARLGANATKARRLFAGAMSIVDRQVGALVDALEGAGCGMAERAIIVVVSDNGGGPAGGGSNYPLRGQKYSLWEGGVRVPALVHSRLLPAAARGSTFRGLFHASDLLPTLLCGALGAHRESLPRASALGVDQWRALTGEAESAGGAAEPRPSLLVSMQYLTRPHLAYDDHILAALVVGDLKVISSAPLCAAPTPTEDFCNCSLSAPAGWLFNLTADPSESADLRLARPRDYAAMRTELERIYAEELPDSICGLMDIHAAQTAYRRNSPVADSLTHWRADPAQNASFPKKPLRDVFF